MTLSFASERSGAASKSAKDQLDARRESASFQDKRYPKSLLNGSSRRKASSSLSLKMRKGSVTSDISLNGPLSRSISSYKNLGSLSSIENSWTKLFSRSVNSLCSSLSVDDASYDIINRDEAGTFFTSQVMEEDVVKLALPVGTEFHLSCKAMWRIFKVRSCFLEK